MQSKTTGKRFKIHRNPRRRKHTRVKRLAEYLYGTEDADISLVKTSVILSLQNIVILH